MMHVIFKDIQSLNKLTQPMYYRYCSFDQGLKETNIMYLTKEYMS